MVWDPAQTCPDPGLLLRELDLARGGEHREIHFVLYSTPLLSLSAFL